MPEALFRPSDAPVELRVVTDITTRTVERMARRILIRQRLLLARQLVISAMALALPAAIVLLRVRQRQVWWFAAFVGVWILILAARLPGSVARMTVRRMQRTPGGIGPFEVSFSRENLWVRNTESRHEYRLRNLSEVVLLPEGLLIVIALGQGILIEPDCHVPDGMDFPTFARRAMQLWLKSRQV